MKLLFERDHDVEGHSVHPFWSIKRDARNVLGWTPSYAQLDTIVEDAWRWEKRLFEAR